MRYETDLKAWIIHNSIEQMQFKQRAKRGAVIGGQNDTLRSLFSFGFKNLGSPRGWPFHAQETEKEWDADAGFQSACIKGR